MEVMPGTGRRIRFIRSPSLSLRSACVCWGIKERTVISKWGLILFQELLLKKLHSRSILRGEAQSGSESSRGNSPRTTAQGEKSAYETQASGLQDGCRALSPQWDTPHPHHSLGWGVCANGKMDQEKRRETWGKHDMAITLTGR